MKLFSGKSMLAAGAALCGGFVWLIAPGSYSEAAAEPFKKRFIAHRGLHSKDQSVPENSLRAFEAAAERGYAIELDVQLTKDGEVVVMHDDDLQRACGDPAFVSEKTLEELRGLRLFGTEEGIPLFKEVLAKVDGRVPLLVELKSQGARNSILCKKTNDLLFAYRGPYCIESFDPRILRWFRKHAPWVFRGQLATHPDNYDDGTPGYLASFLGHCFFNFSGRPQFISYDLSGGGRPLSVKAAERLGAMRFSWTSHAAFDSLDSDAVIFEYYEPDVRFQ